MELLLIYGFWVLVKPGGGGGKSYCLLSKYYRLVLLKTFIGMITQLITQTGTLLSVNEGIINI